jgi:hypothetical protein
MKNKNPLYVVKGKEVQAASNVFDLVVKKLNLEPLIELLLNIFNMLLEQVRSFETFKAVKDYLDEVLASFLKIAEKLKLV